MDSPVAFNYLGTYDLAIVVGTKEFQFQMKDCFDHSFMNSVQNNAFYGCGQSRKFNDYSCL